MTPRFFKRIPSLPTLTVKPLIWSKWYEGPCALWEPTKLAGDFRPGVALAVCYSLYQGLPQDNLWEKKAISLSIIYVPEHWILPSFEESSYVINAAQINGTQVHKKDRLRMCGYAHDFTVAALHRRLDSFCKSGKILSWAPPAFWSAPPSELLLITRSSGNT